MLVLRGSEWFFIGVIRLVQNLVARFIGGLHVSLPFSLPCLADIHMLKVVNLNRKTKPV